MKKMSEVFELPINHERLEVYGVGHIKLALPEVEKHAARAINHVDALADVIENVLHHHGDSLSYEIKSWAQEALASYRGEA